MGSVEAVTLPPYGLEEDRSCGGTEEQEDNEKEEGSEDDPIADEKEDFYRSMLNDCLYESNNEFDIPNLLLEEQAGKLLKDHHDDGRKDEPQ